MTVKEIGPAIGSSSPALYFRMFEERGALKTGRSLSTRPAWPYEALALRVSSTG